MVVLAVLVRLPRANRPWALPVLVDRYRSAADNEAGKRAHRTPARIMMTRWRLRPRWFPRRRSIFVGDSADGTHEVARFVHRHRVRLSLVGKRHPEANLFEPPPPYCGKGRPPVRGSRRPKPSQAVAAAMLQSERVAWYGGGHRDVGATTGTGHGCKSGEGLVPLAWVFVQDQTGTHRDEYVFSADTAMTAVAIIGAYRGRRNIEATSQEVRSHLGLGSTRGWCRRTVSRAAPCLFGLHSVVAWLYQGLPGSKRSGRAEWPGKGSVTFPDAITSVRRWLWPERVFARVGGSTALDQLPEPMQKALLHALAPAA